MLNVHLLWCIALMFAAVEWFTHKQYIYVGLLVLKVQKKSHFCVL